MFAFCLRAFGKGRRLAIFLRTVAVRVAEVAALAEVTTRLQKHLTCRARRCGCLEVSHEGSPGVALRAPNSEALPIATSAGIFSEVSVLQGAQASHAVHAPKKPQVRRSLCLA